MKMSGTGNDFIIIDHRKKFIPLEFRAAFAKAVCQRKFSVGADGLILIQNSDQADFSWDFYNADGSSAEMCGNGARCAARFAYMKKIAPAAMRFETIAGIIEAEVVDHSVKLKMTQPEGLALDLKIDFGANDQTIHFINTGVPHAIFFVKDNRETPIVNWGSAIRFHEKFQPAGTNANFVEVIDRKTLSVRTYERGVENETMACGTGAVGAALIAAILRQVDPPVTVITSGGEKLIIHFSFENTAPPVITDVYLEGPASLIYEGQLEPEALRTLQPKPGS